MSRASFQSRSVPTDRAVRRVLVRNISIIRSGVNSGQACSVTLHFCVSPQGALLMQELLYVSFGAKEEEGGKAMNIYTSKYKTYWSDHSAITEDRREEQGGENLRTKDVTNV